ncbi:hypothetical protein [Epilithonimonas zeae]|uniref:hypothetical protein n=1 Tax=Epilithonimonas zeae TaxID=1416779 RepID=UPI00200BB16D|nr:hypothetical protein [Epilithonimonas zeae]UQB68670.1 hypothetical protein KI430_16925 [Epilithonimonas zeae]
MKEENLNRLNSLFSNLKSEEERLKESQEKQKSEEDLFVEGFKTLCKNLIDPKMQEFRRMLRQNGFGCKITFNEESKSGTGINAQPNIKLQISRNVDSNFYTNNKFPHIMFTADKYYKKIGIHLDTIFQNGKGTAALKEQTYTLKTLDEEAVEKEIVESIEKILINK